MNLTANSVDGGGGVEGKVNYSVDKTRQNGRGGEERKKTQKNFRDYKRRHGDAKSRGVFTVHERILNR